MNKAKTSKGIKAFQVVSNSMYPLLVKGDTILVKEIKSLKALSVGDCLLYKSTLPRPTCHRLIKIRDRILFLKGDCSLKMDRLVPFADVLGKVIAIEKQRKLIFLNSFSHKVRARIAAWLSGYSVKFGFLMRPARLLYFSFPEIVKRLSGKLARCR